MSGGIDITLTWNGRHVTAVDIVMQRPRATRLLLGLPHGQALALLPRLYSLCGKAQGAAARLALAAAGADVGPARLTLDEQKQLLVEQAQEHLWRLLRDWPIMLGLPAHDVEFTRCYRQLAALATSLDRRTESAHFLAWVERDLLGIVPGGAALALPLLARLQNFDGVPEQVSAGLPLHLRAIDFAPAWPADFADYPRWQGLPAETGSSARWARAGQGGLVARLNSRLLALLACTRQLVALAVPGNEAAADEIDTTLADSVPLPDNGGLARVDTARGMLLHRLQLAGERIADYQVVAPTEWNFHPQGACAVALAALQADDEVSLRALAGCWLTAFDPCVGWTLKVINSKHQQGIKHA